MDTRVSLRSQGRYYKPFRTEAITAADAAAANKIGTLTKQQVLALLWRVKKLRIVASMSYTVEAAIPGDPDVAMSVSVNRVIPRTFDEEGFEFGAELEAKDFLKATMDFPYVRFEAFTDPDIAIFSIVSGFDAAYILLDEAEDYWLPSAPECDTDSTDDTHRPSWSIAPPDYEVTTELLFTGTLEVLGASISIPMIAKANSVGTVSVDAAAFAVTVEEWYPYATTAGAAAWNTTTGAPANGGPGA
jgi:hypothetical protein